MAVGFVETQFATTAAATTTISVTIDLAPGNGVVIDLMFSDVSGSVGTITQTAGDMLGAAHVSQSDATAGYQLQYSNDNVAGGNTTFTFTWGANHSASVFATEISGQVTSSAFDQSATVAGTTATTHASGTTGTLSQADEIAIVCWDGDGSGTTGNVSVDSGFTIPTNGNQFGAGITGIRGCLAYKVVAATSAVSCTLSQDNAIANGLIGTYKAAASGGLTAAQEVPIFDAQRSGTIIGRVDA